MRQLAFVFEFPARFEVAQLERIDRLAWERVLRYPGERAALEPPLADRVATD